MVFTTMALVGGVYLYTTNKGLKSLPDIKDAINNKSQTSAWWHF